ncbi:lysine-specific demethylase 3A-B [Adelges cooleyi]|uniref:lysine-specific demethylase 3A-B n=1 Tax=Adelges cooleyi TaxID=133065 RepID=UPI0021808FBC|nr:lysine-specific demethylase 3A-B [Adelges cooleyi]XP_050437573.1 lysine-specific demethylase 3A-B [Adelges cooleyi]
MLQVKKEYIGNCSNHLEYANGLQVKEEFQNKSIVTSLSINQNTNNECDVVVKKEGRNEVLQNPNSHSCNSKTKDNSYKEKVFVFNYKYSNDNLLSNANLKTSKGTENSFDRSNISEKTKNITSTADSQQLNDEISDCIKAINSDVSTDKDDIILVDHTVEDDSLSNNYSPNPNRKRKMIHSKRSYSSSSWETDSDNSSINKKKKLPKNKNLIKSNFRRQKPISGKELALGIPDIFTDQAEDVLLWKTTLERFLQNCLCLSLPPKISKCIECRLYQSNTNLTKRDYDSITCRFYAFRLLRFTKTGKLSVAGYLDPYKDLSNLELNMWLPDTNNVPENYDVQVSIKVLEDAGGQFCKFVQDENEALRLNWPIKRKKRRVAWKKNVNGIREMCDVCKTTIFNHHWVCGKCGFVVCVDCYKSKLLRVPSPDPSNCKKAGDRRKRDKDMWLYCSDQEEHQLDQLTITQILAGDSLNLMSKYMHTICFNHKIRLNCECLPKPEIYASPVDLRSISDMCMNNVCSSSDEEDEINTPALKKLLSKKCFAFYVQNKTEEDEIVSSTCSLGDPFINNEVDQVNKCINTKVLPMPKLSLLTDNLTDVPHMWLCDGRLLRLLDPMNNANYNLFQNQWKRGQPVMVSDVGKNLSPSLWHPKSFSRDFGDHINDLINCANGKLVRNQPMRKFWDGFENAAERLYDNKGSSMLLKLKDWPPSADFAETLPDRFQDLMNSLPLKEYTHRNGKFNLASRLPEGFVRPDLGPKMYTAYGNAGTKCKLLGTTNLHLDISDAVNVMVFVSITKNCKELDYNWHIEQAHQVIEEAGCDDFTKQRVYEHGEIPGALWHIYHASDADCIRDLLNKVSIEQGIYPKKHHDPIHDQSHYLDANLRERLFRDYGVKGYPIVQCYGDAVFIPAGAPHQVRNLHNCIKVAEDFVSPENVHHSFRMTQEFRDLTDGHTNHEDKLQIKNIVFHAIKDSLSVLMKQHKQ